MTADRSPAADVLLAQIERACALSVLGRDEELITALREALADDAAAGSADTAVLRALALTVIAQSLVRQGHFAEAIQTYASAPCDLDGPGHIEVRTRILLGMGLAYAHQCMPEQALRMGDAALRLALAHEMTTLAAAALECVGVCHALQDDLTHADQLMHESLGLALQTGDETVVHRCLNNLLFLSQTIFDAYRQQGDADNARVALSRCARFAARGDRLSPRVGVYERCLWRSNRAGWQLRRGNPEEARAEFTEVEREAQVRGWPKLVCFAQLSLATLHHEKGEDAEALTVLDGVLSAGPAINGYDLRLKAHQLAQDVLTGQGRFADAAAHRVAHRLLAEQRAAERAQTAHVLPQFGHAVLEALAEADRVRIRGEVDELRRQQIEASNAAFLSTDWSSAPG